MPQKKVTRVEFPAKLLSLSQSTLLKRVAAYAGVPTVKDAQENSLQSQQEYFTEYIRHHPDWVFAGMYTDDGVSGLSIRRRDGFNRMVNDALDGKIDLILTKSLSRFARNTVDALTTIRKRTPSVANRRVRLQSICLECRGFKSLLFHIIIFIFQI